MNTINYTKTVKNLKNNLIKNIYNRVKSNKDIIQFNVNDDEECNHIICHIGNGEYVDVILEKLYIQDNELYFDAFGMIYGYTVKKENIKSLVIEDLYNILLSLL